MKNNKIKWLGVGKKGLRCNESCTVLIGVILMLVLFEAFV
jgi:hypothetical protein